MEDLYIQSPDHELRTKLWNIHIPVQIELNIEDIIGTERPRTLMVVYLLGSCSSLRVFVPNSRSNQGAF